MRNLIKIASLLAAAFVTHAQTPVEDSGLPLPAKAMEYFSEIVIQDGCVFRWIYYTAKKPRVDFRLKRFCVPPPDYHHVRNWLRPSKYWSKDIKPGRSVR